MQFTKLKLYLLIALTYLSVLVVFAAPTHAQHNQEGYGQYDKLYYANEEWDCFEPLLVAQDDTQYQSYEGYLPVPVSPLLCVRGKNSISLGQSSINPFTGLCSDKYFDGSSGERIVVIWPADESKCKSPKVKKPQKLRPPVQNKLPDEVI